MAGDAALARWGVVDRRHPDDLLPNMVAIVGAKGRKLEEGIWGVGWE